MSDKTLSITSLAIAGALTSALALRCRDPFGRAGGHQGEMLRRGAEGPERLRRRRRHHLRRDLQGRLPGQRLEARRQGQPASTTEHAARPRAPRPDQAAGLTLRGSTRHSAHPPAPRTRNARDARKTGMPRSLDEDSFGQPLARPRASARALGLKPRARRRRSSTTLPDVGFFEVHAENYMGAGGPPHRCLRRIRERLSALGAWRRPVDRRRRAARPRSPGAAEDAARALSSRRLFSEHLAWSSHDGVFLNDLLPRSLRRGDASSGSASHIDQVQDDARRPHAAGKSLDLRCSSSASTMCGGRISARGRRAHRLRAAARRQQRLSSRQSITASMPTRYLDAFPVEYVGEIHLAGFAEDRLMRRARRC